MNVLFVHNNFPAQYRYLVRALARDPSVKMVAIGSSTSREVPGVELRKYALGASNLAGTHPFARRFDLECQRAEQVLYALSSLVSSGFSPDVILAHPGWGETLPLRVMFPKARLLLNCGNSSTEARAATLISTPNFQWPGLMAISRSSSRTPRHCWR